MLFPWRKKMVSKKVLVVDDEQHILFILEQELKQHGCVVQKANSGKDAIKLLDSNVYDIVILDIMMPEVSGIDVCRHLRSKPKMKDKPVVILTADQDEKNKEECVSLDVADYITKPFSPKNLSSRVKEILDKY